MAKTKSKKNIGHVAVLTIHGLDSEKFDIDRLKEWLHGQANFFEDKEPADFGNIFTARLMK